MKTMDQRAAARRQFIIQGGVLAAGAALLLPSRLLAAPGEAAEAGVTPTEDLMREHGVLRRVLMIFDTIAARVQGSADFPPATLSGATKIIRTFIQDYHEKDEERALFPRFEKAGKLLELVRVLFEQHQAGRRVITALEGQTTADNLKSLAGREKVRGLLLSFNRMYRPHAAWEDTVLYPAFRTVITPREFIELGDKFEEREQKLFGKNGFDKVVAEVAGLEKELNLYNLSQFTPKI